MLSMISKTLFEFMQANETIPSDVAQAYYDILSPEELSYVNELIGDVKFESITDSQT